MKTVAIVLAALALTACGPSKEDLEKVKELRHRVAVSEEIVASAHHTASIYMELRDEKKMKVAVADEMKAKGDLEAHRNNLKRFCEEHLEACERVKRLEEATK